ncbi:MAG: glycerophosphoryl diester phosphodiesterase [Magnetovibrio sp.]|nr:glycerophosphoryl diester phosphodiesterase [Magnetovibrio sp.]|tara:strand:- start:1438 stop:2199 length:762 start_codon:yes stop_codon:yes gene_type:complete
MQDTEIPRVLGHRGAAGYAPENTLASIRYAAQLGVKWIEIDARLTFDEVPVVFHDDRLGRTTNGRGSLSKKLLAEISELDAGAWFGSSFVRQRIPTLLDALEEIERLGLGLNLELKCSPGKEKETGRIMASVLQSFWSPKLPVPVVSSFKAAALSAFSEVAPNFKRALIVHRLPKDWLPIGQLLGVSAIHCDCRYLKHNQVRNIRQHGLAVRCFTVNQAEIAARLFSWGVTSVFSDFPDQINQSVKALGIPLE